MAGERNAEVISAAIRVFGQYGYSSASVQDVADALNMPKGTLYHYIKSKEDLLTKIFDSSHDELQVIRSDLNAQADGGLEQLRFFIERYVLWSIEHIDKAKIYSREWRYLSCQLRRSVIERRRGLDAVMESLIEVARQGGEIDPATDTQRSAFFIWAAISSVPDWYSRGGPETPEKIAESYAILAINSLTGHATASSPPETAAEIACAG